MNRAANKHNRGRGSSGVGELGAELGCMIRILFFSVKGYADVTGTSSYEDI